MAAKATKGQKKKWTKQQNKEKRDWSPVLLEEVAADVEKNVPRSKLITPNKVAERYKISLTVARKILKQFVAEQKMVELYTHHGLYVYGRSASYQDQPVVETTAAEGGEKKPAAKKGGKAAAKKAIAQDTSEETREKGEKPGPKPKEAPKKKGGKA